jgi:putative phosphoribosyl transferase
MSTGSLIVANEPQTLRAIIPAHGAGLLADLTLPDPVRGVVVFAHGSGSGRTSPRNQQVAKTLNEAGLATVLFDLLSSDEEALDARTGSFRFDIALLTRRLLDTTDWLMMQPEVHRLPLGYFGASTGAAAALGAAALRPGLVHAVVARGGRPDLALSALPNVRAATLLIVGGNDAPVIRMNENALTKLPEPKRLAIVPDATHLFEEPGALEQVAKLAVVWFDRYLCGSVEHAPDADDEC